MTKMTTTDRRWRRRRMCPLENHRNSYSEPEFGISVSKLLGFDTLVSKKVSVSVSKNFGIEKNIGFKKFGIGFEIFLYRIKYKFRKIW